VTIREIEEELDNIEIAINSLKNANKSIFLLELRRIWLINQELPVVIQVALESA
jgi:hypothetical protein